MMLSAPIKDDAQSKESTLSYLAVAVALSLLVCTIFVLDVPAFDVLPYWFLRLHRTTLDMRWIGTALAALVVAFAVVGRVRSVKTRVFVLVLLAWSVQLSVAMSRNQGFEGLRSRIVTTGHAEFARVAARETSVFDVLTNYEPYVRSGRLGIYSPTKPPGTLLFYMGTDRASRIACTAGESHLACMQTFAAWAWSFLSCLVMVPLFYLARRWASETVGWLSCLLYMTTPTVNIFTLHLDQVLFPILALLVVGLTVQALDSGKRRFAIAAGCTLYSAVFCSFGLAMIVPLLIVPFVTAWMKGTPMRKWSTPILYGGIGLAACDIVARGFSYRMFVRYSAARDVAVAWRGWDDSLDTLLRASLTNLVEFSVWAGPAVVVSIVCVSAVSFNRISRTSPPNPALWLGPALSLTILLLLLVTKTKTETSRLWLFLVPFCCICTAWLVQQDDVTRTRWGRWVVLVTCQFATTVAILRHGVFF